MRAGGGLAAAADHLALGLGQAARDAGHMGVADGPLPAPGQLRAEVEADATGDGVVGAAGAVCPGAGREVLPGGAGSLAEARDWARCCWFAFHAFQAAWGLTPAWSAIWRGVIAPAAMASRVRLGWRGLGCCWRSETGITGMWPAASRRARAVATVVLPVPACRAIISLERRGLCRSSRPAASLASLGVSAAQGTAQPLSQPGASRSYARAASGPAPTQPCSRATRSRRAVRCSELARGCAGRSWQARRAGRQA